MKPKQGQGQRQGRGPPVTETLEYLYRVAVEMPLSGLARSKCREIVGLAGRNQLKLRRMKRTICRQCRALLVPRVTCTLEYVRRENGLGLLCVCAGCQREEFTVIRGKRRGCGVHGEE